LNFLFDIPTWSVQFIFRTRMHYVLLLMIASCGSGSTTDTTAPTTTAATPTVAASGPLPGSSSPSSPVSAPGGAASAPVTASGTWTPALTDTWQWQLRGTVNTSYAVKVYDIDLFDTSALTIQSLKQSGKHVVCYFSAGSSENWRPDFAQFQPTDLGNALQGWPGERWLDTRSSNVRKIMQTRLDLAVSKGCDGVEPDNVDGYTNNPGVAISAASQLDYNRFIAAQAHLRGLRVALKNDTDQVADLSNDFDFAVNEQCHEFSQGGISECDVYAAFTKLGKPVFHAEYKTDYVSNAGGARDVLCAASKAANLRTLVLPLQLDDTLRYSCD
jgi:hypothetical protein